MIMIPIRGQRMSEHMQATKKPFPGQHLSAHEPRSAPLLGQHMNVYEFYDPGALYVYGCAGRSQGGIASQGTQGSIHT